MIYRRRRIISPEILDDQPPGVAEPSLRDLVRINRLSGSYRILQDLLEELVDRHEPFSLLDVGAASGDTAVAVRRRFPKATVVSLDYRAHHLRRAPVPKLAADAFRLPFTGSSFDFVHCALFLHHFTNSQITGLLSAFGRVARRQVLVNDLERHWIPFYFLPFTRPLYRWNQITLHDGPISVQAGFSEAELVELASSAGLTGIVVRSHRPAFRLSLLANGTAQRS
jgi:hypothetical protein